MKRVELLSGLVAAVFGLVLMLLVPDAWTATVCVAGGQTPNQCIQGEAFTASVGAMLSLLFVVGGLGTSGYAIVTARPG